MQIRCVPSLVVAAVQMEHVSVAVTVNAYLPVLHTGIQWVVGSIPPSGPTEVGFLLPANTPQLVCIGSSNQSHLVESMSIAHPIKCSTTGVTNIMVCAILFVEW